MGLSEHLPATDWRLRIDFFGYEAEHFERDVHVIIDGSLDAGIKYLDMQFEKHSARLVKRIEETKNEEQKDLLIDDHVSLVLDLADQKRFLRNMALVALLSRLTHVLNGLARLAEDFSPRNLEGYEGENEFKKIWREYDERFCIKLRAKHIQWIEPLRKARNLIVHNGGEANPLKREVEVDINTKFEDRRDTSFSEKYSQFVDGTGYSAEVSISEKQLNEATEKAIDLTKWVSVELRAKQLEYTKSLRTESKSSIKKT